MFIQMMEGQVGDLEALRARLAAWMSDLRPGAEGWLGTKADELDAVLRRMRPDVIGGTAAWPGDETFIQTVYFTSEGEARASESATPTSDQDRADAERLMSLMQVDRYIDLLNPMLYSH